MLSFLPSLATALLLVTPALVEPVAAYGGNVPRSVKRLDANMYIRDAAAAAAAVVDAKKRRGMDASGFSDEALKLVAARDRHNIVARSSRAMRKRACRPTETTSTATHTTKHSKPTSTSSSNVGSDPDADSATPNPAAGKSGKKGLGWSSGGQSLASVVNDQVTYFYNWGANMPSAASEAGLVVAPMLWGTKNLADFRKARTNKNYKVLMGMNEVNLASQSNIGVAQGIKMWNEEIVPYAEGRYLVSPSVTSAGSGKTWLKNFFAGCNNGKKNCGANAISLHKYSLNYQDIIDYVEEMHQEFPDLDVWLSEFACQKFGSGDVQHCDAGTAANFMTKIVEWAEKTDYVTMYAAWGWKDSLGSGLSLLSGSHTPTSVGKAFLQS